ncbi:MAG TPA: 16S rRNA (guanine(966)-N(2))-methyltransferase RsmD [Vicinamibacterales bacterium]|nr:16S rRNA (guanine(966)-N(2))-methyltransferase RsmD [Vicinamibacterales bacterium]
MRVIAGALKGRRLDAPDWPGLRPTSDKLRETLFNVLAPRVPDARVLDGYAGTGAVGIEALSRGASHVTFVDGDPRAVRLIDANLRRCQVTDRYAIIRARFEESAPRLPAPFDLVFLDPPYGADTIDTALTAASSLIAADGVLVLEHARRDTAPARIGRLELTRDLVSGDSALAFYRTSRAADEG